MHRHALQLASLVVLSTWASAQQMDPSQLRPFGSTPKHAGVFDLGTGRFRAAASPSHAAALQTVYANTCTGGGFYTTVTECEDLYDEGRLPDQVGVQMYPDHLVRLIEIAYCTGAVLGTVDLDWELFDTQTALGAGGACTFGSAGTPPPFSAGVVGFSSSAAGFPLPGSTSVGSVGCWIVVFSLGTSSTCITSGPGSADQFVLRFAQNNAPAQLGAAGAGPIVAGAPGTGPVGCGTFGIPPCIDPVTFVACGSGLDAQDGFWINQDGGTTGGVCATGGVGYPFGGCYWFGGYPTNPFAGIYLRMEGDGSCSPTGDVVGYCTAKVNSLGCTPTLSWSGIPQYAQCATSPFVLSASNLVGSKNGLWFYGTSGLTGIGFQGGHLCAKPPIRRLAVQNSGGQGTACNGSIAIDFNAQICSGADPSLVPGALVGAQCWSRDPAGSFQSNLSAGVAFTVVP